MSTLPRSALSSVTPFMLASSFTFSFVTSHFLTSDPSLLATTLFWLSIFVKRHTVPSLGDKEATQLQSLLSVHELSHRRAVAIHSQTSKEVMGVGHPSWRTPVIYSDLWTDKLTMKCVPYAVPVITEIWTVALRDWGHLEWQLKFMHGGTVQSKDCLLYLCREH